MEQPFALCQIEHIGCLGSEKQRAIAKQKPLLAVAKVGFVRSSTEIITPVVATSNQTTISMLWQVVVMAPASSHTTYEPGNIAHDTWACRLNLSCYHKILGSSIFFNLKHRHMLPEIARIMMTCSGGALTTLGFIILPVEGHGNALFHTWPLLRKC